MKCPSCDSRISDLRDLCPQCLTDLRSFKKAVGVKITHPNLTYEELRAKEDTRPRPPPGSLLKSKPLTEPSSLKKAPSMESSSSRPEVSFTWKEETSPASGPPTPTEEASPRPPPIELYHVIEDELLKGLPLHPPEEAVQTTQAENGPTTIPNREPPSVVLPTAMPTVTIQSAPVSPQLQDKSPPDTHPSLDQAPIATPQRSANEIDLLFSAASQEISAPATLSVSVEQLQKLDQGHSREMIELYFSLSHESINNPDFERTLAQKIADTESRILSSSELTSKLQDTESALSTPLLSLKGGTSRAIPQPGSAPELDLRTPLFSLPSTAPIASRGIRILGAVVDLLAMLIVSLGCGVVLFGELPEGVTSPLAAEMIPLYASIIISFTLILGWYQFVSVMLFGTTAGAAATGIKIANSDGKEIPLSKLFVRSLTIPLSLVVGGGLPVLFHRRPLHDVLSRSTVIDTRER